MRVQEALPITSVHRISVGKRNSFRVQVSTQSKHIVQLHQKTVIKFPLLLGES